jgi:hypothetical protein
MTDYAHTDMKQVLPQNMMVLKHYFSTSSDLKLIGKIAQGFSPHPVYVAA